MSRGSSDATSRIYPPCVPNITYDQINLFGTTLTSITLTHVPSPGMGAKAPFGRTSFETTRQGQGLTEKKMNHVSDGAMEALNDFLFSMNLWSIIFTQRTHASFTSLTHTHAPHPTTTLKVELSKRRIASFLVSVDVPCKNWRNKLLSSKFAGSY